MARKPTNAGLTASLANYQELATVAQWLLRDAGAYPAESYIVIRRPRSGALIVRTTDVGTVSYWFEPTDSGRVAKEFRMLSDAPSWQWDSLNDAITLARRLDSGEDAENSSR